MSDKVLASNEIQSYAFFQFSNQGIITLEILFRTMAHKTPKPLSTPTAVTGNSYGVFALSAYSFPAAS